MHWKGPVSIAGLQELKIKVPFRVIPSLPPSSIEGVIDCVFFSHETVAGGTLLGGSMQGSV